MMQIADNIVNGRDKAGLLVTRVDKVSGLIDIIGIDMYRLMAILRDGSSHEIDCFNHECDAYAALEMMGFEDFYLTFY